MKTINSKRIDRFHVCNRKSLLAFSCIFSSIRLIGNDYTRQKFDMKQEELTEKVKEIMFQQGSEPISAQELHAQIEGVAIIQIHRALKEMVDKQQVVLVKEEKAKKYVLIEHTSVKVDKSGRDVSTYELEGERLRKGRLALRVIQRFARENNAGLKEIQELFPNEIVKPYGLTQPLLDAKKISGKRDRFFMKDGDQIITPDGPICVSNQITKERVENIIKIAQETLGYEIN
jgi:hypothetical protein